MLPILWERKDTHSVEYFELISKGDRFTLKGGLVLLLDGLPAQISYTIECNNGWRTRSAEIHQQRAGETKQLSLKINDEQVWQTDQGKIAFANGFFDVDLEITPATNTLPIRRLDLKPGESREVSAVWIRFPSLTPEPLRQRYTRISERAYQYESLTGYSAQLEVDDFGLVIHYDDVWHRVSA